LVSRTSGNITIKVGRCEVGNEAIMERWKRVKATTIPKQTGNKYFKVLARASEVSS
jgi:hypothetical protein